MPWKHAALVRWSRASRRRLPVLAGTAPTAGGGVTALEGINIQEIRMPDEGGRFLMSVLVLGAGSDYGPTCVGMGAATQRYQA